MYYLYLTIRCYINKILLVDIYMINVNVIHIFILAIRIYNLNPFVGICTLAVNMPTAATKQHRGVCKDMLHQPQNTNSLRDTGDNTTPNYVTFDVFPTFNGCTMNVTHTFDYISVTPVCIYIFIGKS